MMWNKGNGGSANQDGARWFLRSSGTSKLQAWRVLSKRCPKYDGRMGLSPQRYVWHGSRNQGGRLEERSRMLLTL